MSGDEIKQKIIAILAEQAMLDLPDVEAATTLADIGIDSLGLVESIFAIEEAFDISVPFNANDPDASAFDITSIETIVAAVKDLIKDQAS
ncbi:MAG: acyl carrier protein [Pseudomonadota bacterium]